MAVKLEREGRVVTVRLDRPQARNALDTPTLNDMIRLMAPLDADADVGCFIVTGSDTVFSAGADIREMAAKTHADVVREDYFGEWDRFTALRTPKIAAVSGPALGGGCELAMMCDIIIAADTATFGQPEITLGVIPGIGGTQRLTRLVGRSRALDLILTGRSIDAPTAESWGLVSRVVPGEQLMEVAREAAARIAGFGTLAVTTAREAVDRAQESGLREGLLFERRAFHALFAGHDQREGMQAFLEKRRPHFSGQ